MYKVSLKILFFPSLFLSNKPSSCKQKKPAHLYIPNKKSPPTNVITTETKQKTCLCAVINQQLNKATNKTKVFYIYNSDKHGKTHSLTHSLSLKDKKVKQLNKKP